jgi:Spy/CpxP family protein refolding chaperone
MNPSRMFRKLQAVTVLMTTSNSPFSMAAMLMATSAWQRVSKELYRMKKVLICALLAIALACCGTALYAQDNMGQGQMGQGQGQMGPGGGHRGMMSPDQRLQHLTKMLNLTPDQQQKIKPMLEQEQTQMQSLHQDTSMTQADRMTKMQQIREGTNDQIKSVLTADQQTKFTQMQDRQMEHMGQHGGMGQGQSQPQQAPPQQ